MSLEEKMGNSDLGWAIVGWAYQSGNLFSIVTREDSENILVLYKISITNSDAPLLNY